MRRLHRDRVLIRRGNRALLYFAPTWAVATIIGLICVFTTAAIITDYLLAGAVAVAVVIVAWLGLSLRVARLAPVGRRRGGGTAPPGGAGVREPRRPLPNAPAGAAAIPIPDEQTSPSF